MNLKERMIQLADKLEIDVKTIRDFIKTLDEEYDYDWDNLSE